MRKLLLLTAVLLTVTAVILSAGCVQFHMDTDTTPTPTPEQVLPTASPTSTATPVATATPKPAQTQMPSHKIDGSGSMETWQIWLDTGVSQVTAKNYGSGNFIVWLSKGGKHQDLLFNELGAYEGETAFEVEEAGYYTFDVIASGTWTLTVNGPYNVNVSSFNDYRSNGIMFITGANTMTSSPFTLEKGVAVFNGYYLGSDRITATLYANGISAGTIDSDTGAAKTQKVYPVTIAGSYTLNVNTAGEGPATVVFYQPDGSIAGSVVIPAGVTDYNYLLKNPNGGKTTVCLVAVTADGAWSVSGTHY